MGKFVIKQNNSGFTFNLKAVNGQIVAVGGEVFNTLSTCKNSIESVVKNAPVAKVEDQTVEEYEVIKHPKFEIYLDKAGEFRFRLKARNGEPILASQGYNTKVGCKNGIESVRKNVATPTVIERE